MAELTIGDFENREYRFDIVTKKIDSKTPFDMEDGSSEVLQFNGKIIKRIFKEKDFEGLSEFKGKRDFFPFKNARNTEFKMKDITKTGQFGGGAGSGGGASKTDKQEALQCFYLSYLLNNGIDKYTKENHIKVSVNKDLAHKNNLQYCHTKTFKTQKDVKKLLTDNDLLDWLTHGRKGDDLNVFMKIANQIKSHMSENSKFKFSGPYHVHHKSAFMDAVYESYKKVLEVDKKSETPKAPAGFSPDKWNPGDIWISSMNPSDNESTIFGETHLGDDKIDFKKEPNFEELKQAVFKLARDGKLLGVSLKKVSDNANTKELNIPNQRKYNEKVKINNFSFGLTPKGTVDDFFSSSDIYLNFSNGERMQLRTFDGAKSWQGEVKGSLAAQGKIGGGAVNYYTEKYLKKQIGGGESSKWSEIKFRNPDFLKIFELYKKYASHDKNSHKIQDKDVIKKLSNFESKVCTVKNHHSFMFSKYMCLLFLDTICTKTGFTTKNFQPFCTQMLRYAMSNVDESSYHLKVSNN
tara:strand:+ start:43 stop:1605 length:1563 start_codon:yes stop_codon:yes gene_type:complete